MNWIVWNDLKYKNWIGRKILIGTLNYAFRTKQNEPKWSQLLKNCSEKFLSNSDSVNFNPTVTNLLNTS